MGLILSKPVPQDLKFFSCILCFPVSDLGLSTLFLASDISNPLGLKAVSDTVFLFTKKVESWKVYPLLSSFSSPKRVGGGTGNAPGNGPSSG